MKINTVSHPRQSKKLWVANGYLSLQHLWFKSRPKITSLATLWGVLWQTDKTNWPYFYNRLFTKAEIISGTPIYAIWCSCTCESQIKQMLEQKFTRLVGITLKRFEFDSIIVSQIYYFSFVLHILTIIIFWSETHSYSSGFSCSKIRLLLFHVFANKFTLVN